MKTEKNFFWLVVFVLGVITIAARNYYGPLPEDTTQFIRAFISTFVADLFITPLVAWLGMTLGNQYRQRQHNNAFIPDAD